jgi:uncharacterized protein (TIGR03083 family)
VKVDAHIRALEAQGAGLAAAAAAAGPEAEVPTCPGWRVRDLLAHAGGVHRWAASYVEGRRTSPWTTEEEARFFHLRNDQDPVDWYTRSLRELINTLRDAAPDTACWSFLPSPTPLAFWARRQAHEAAIHRVDAERAASHDSPQYDPAFASDGLDELICGFQGRGRGRLRADPPRTMTIAATDHDRGWTVHIGPDRRTGALGAATDADLTVSGTASDLYLLLWNRGDEARVVLDGDRDLLDMWREKAVVTWA